MTLEEAADDARQRPVADLPREAFRDLCQREIRLRGNPAKDQLCMGIDPVRAHVAPALVRFEMAPQARSRHPAHHGRDANPEPGGSPSARNTSLNGIYDTAAKVDGKSFGHQGWPPSPAPTMKHAAARMGIP
jgi:hypothetical protein